MKVLCFHFWSQVKNDFLREIQHSPSLIQALAYHSVRFQHLLAAGFSLGPGHVEMSCTCS